MKDRLAAERGSVLITAMVLMSIMLVVGLATYSLVESQTRESGFERIRETSFNVGEGLLGSQVFILSRGWPGTASQAYPTCQAGVTNAKCPDAPGLVSDFGGPDVARGVTWQTRVVDNALDTISGEDAQTRCTNNRNATPSFYSDANLASAASWDQNGDCRLWVRSTATIAGKRRTFVGLVRVEQITEQFPKNTITAGKVATGNSGNKVLINTQGSAAQPAPVAVRCSEGSGCIDTGKDIQINPRALSYDYPNPTALTADALDRLRERAKSLGTYYETTPASCTQLAGPLVFVENGAISCTGNTKMNSSSVPGTLVVATGTAEFGGNTEYYGIIYMANLQNSSDWVLSTSGTGLIQGSVAVDGPGGVHINASKQNLVYDPNVFTKVVSFGNAGIIQNTWREIKPSG
jgi:Tfp pilus assembly protein PilX